MTKKHNQPTHPVEDGPENPGRRSFIRDALAAAGAAALIPVVTGCDFVDERIKKHKHYVKLTERGGSSATPETEPSEARANLTAREIPEMPKYDTRSLVYQPNEVALKNALKGFKRDEAIQPIQQANTGRPQQSLRITANKAFQYAREIARAQGYDIIVTSGYSPRNSLRTKIKAYLDGKRVAANSWHKSGGTVDVYLAPINDPKRQLTSMKYEYQPLNDRYTILLEKIMNTAGFVRYKGHKNPEGNPEYTGELWHFEFGSPGWADIMQQAGYLDDGKDNRVKHTYPRIGAESRKRTGKRGRRGRKRRRGGGGLFNLPDVGK